MGSLEILIFQTYKSQPFPPAPYLVCKTEFLHLTNPNPNTVGKTESQAECSQPVVVSFAVLPFSLETGIAAEGASA